MRNIFNNMLRRSLQIIKRFNHKHSDKANSFLPKNDFKNDYNKCHESEDKLNENIQDIKVFCHREFASSYFELIGVSAKVEQS